MPDSSNRTPRQIFSSKKCPEQLDTKNTANKRSPRLLDIIQKSRTTLDFLWQDTHKFVYQFVQTPHFYGVRIRASPKTQVTTIPLSMLFIFSCNYFSYITVHSNTYQNAQLQNYLENIPS